MVASAAYSHGLPVERDTCQTFLLQAYARLPSHFLPSHLPCLGGSVVREETRKCDHSRTLSVPGIGNFHIEEPELPASEEWEGLATLGLQRSAEEAGGCRLPPIPSDFLPLYPPPPLLYPSPPQCGHWLSHALPKGAPVSFDCLVPPGGDHR